MTAIAANIGLNPSELARLIALALMVLLVALVNFKLR